MLRYPASARVGRSVAIILAIAAVAVASHAAANPKPKKSHPAAKPQIVASAYALKSHSMRPLDTGSSAPARFFTINQVLAKAAKAKGQDINSSPTRFAALGPSETMSDAIPALRMAPSRGSEPFGLYSFRAPEGLLWVKWRGVNADMQRDAKQLEACRTDAENCSPAAAKFNGIVDTLRSLHGRARYEAVNRLINGAIQYTSDLAQHRVPDLWSSPLSTLTSGRGDCEDYAIAKYVALREAGVSDEDLRIVLVRDHAVRQDHSVLAARHDGRWLILDNRWTQVPSDGHVRSFAPLFAINSKGVKLFVAPYANNLTHESKVSPASNAAIVEGSYEEAFSPLVP